MAAYNSRVRLSPSIEASSVSSYEFADHDPISESECESDTDSSKGKRHTFEYVACSDEDATEEYELESWKRRRNMSRLRRHAVQVWSRYRLDHPRACGGSVMPTPSQPFLFFKLPSEVRIHILGYLLKNDKDVRQMPADKTTNSPALVPVDLRLFAVSRQMKNEAEDLFYTQNMLRLDIHYDMQDLPIWIRQPKDVGKKARSVHLRIGQGPEHAIPALKHWLNIVTQSLMQFQSLNVLKITPFCDGCWELPGYREDFDEAIEVLTNLRRIQTVLWMYENGEILPAQAADSDNQLHSPAGTAAQRERVTRMMMSS